MALFSNFFFGVFRMFSALESGWSFKKGKPDSETGAVHARKRSCFVKRVGKHARYFDVLSGDGFYPEKTLLAIEAHALFALQNPTTVMRIEHSLFKLEAKVKIFWDGLICRNNSRKRQ